MTRSDRRQFVVIAAIAVALWTVLFIRVFSSGEEVARYAAVNAGHRDGDCFVFQVRDGVRRMQRRVCMDHVVESVR